MAPRYVVKTWDVSKEPSLSAWLAEAAPDGYRLVTQFPSLYGPSKTLLVFVWERVDGVYTPTRNGLTVDPPPPPPPHDAPPPEAPADDAPVYVPVEEKSPSPPAPEAPKASFLHAMRSVKKGKKR